MGARFGRNKKRKLLNELSEAKLQLNETKRQLNIERSYSNDIYPDEIVSTRYNMSYNDLRDLHDPHHHKETVPITLQNINYERIKFNAEVRSGPLRDDTLLIQVKCKDRFNYYLSRELLVDLIKQGMPMDVLYKQIYDEFVRSIEKHIHELIEKGR